MNFIYLDDSVLLPPVNIAPLPLFLSHGYAENALIRALYDGESALAAQAKYGKAASASAAWRLAVGSV
jgi:hypothetical protein